MTLRVRDRGRAVAVTEFRAAFQACAVTRRTAELVTVALTAGSASSRRDGACHRHEAPRSAS